MPPNLVVLFGYPAQPLLFTVVRDSSERSSHLITGKSFLSGDFRDTALDSKRVSCVVSQTAAPLLMSRVMGELRESTSSEGRVGIIKQWLLYLKRP